MDWIKTTWWVYGWLFVRPRRWAFSRMICTSYGPRWFPKKHEYFGWQMPDVHWWILYKTVFRFFKWLYWDGWRPLAVWEDGWRKHMPWYAELVHKIGQTTAGFAICGGECFHCGFDVGDPVELSDKEHEYFELTKTGVSSTENGTSYWFEGITTCPACGYKQNYGDGS